MQLTILTSLLTLLATSPLLTHATTYNPWELTPFSTHQSSGRPGNDPNSTITFTFKDPNTATSGACFASFLPTGSDFPKNYFDCTVAGSDPNAYHFAFKIDRYAGIGNLSLTLQHGYHDPAVGTPDYVTAFGSVNITRSANFECVYGASGVGNCGIVSGGMPFLVPITALIA